MRTRTWTRVGNAGLMALLTVVALGCADTSWDGARRRDTVASYHRYLRDNGGSRHAGEAKERIAYLRVQDNPTIEGFGKFVENYPQSTLLPELRTFVEHLFFEHARSINTPAAYSEFLAMYPTGKLTAKATGNLAYVGSVREDPRPDQLRQFVENYPESDFVPEVRTSLELLDQHRRTAIRRLALRVEVAPNVGQAARVRQGFAALVTRHYYDLGVEVTLIAPGGGPPPEVDAWMRLEYHEIPASGTFGDRTLVSQCRVRLYHRDSVDPVWDRSFEAPADHVLQGAYGRDKSVFANSTYRFWEKFFVPVSTWMTSATRLHHVDYPEEVTAIDVRGDRAALLYARGGMDYLDVSTPLEPKVLDRYRRERDLTRWSGVKLLSEDWIVSFGRDGIELVEFAELQPKRLAQFELPEIGSINSVDLYGSTLLLAGTKGVFAVRLQNRPLRPHPLLDGEFVGLFVRKPYIYLVRPEQVELTTPEHLLQHLTGAKLRLGENFGANKARVGGDSLYVFGKEKVVEIHLSDTERPKLVATLPPEKIGALTDLTSDGGHLYLLGNRGLGVAGPSAQWVSDLIQVGADDALTRKGRFLFLVGGRSLEVLDMAPYHTVLASPQR